MKYRNSFSTQITSLNENELEVISLSVDEDISAAKFYFLQSCYGNSLTFTFQIIIKLNCVALINSSQLLH